MLKISSQGITYVAPSAGFSEGELLDNPGDDTGSGAVVATINDLIYAIFAPIKKYIGGVSDTAESEIVSDMQDTIEVAAGTRNPNLFLVPTYDNGVTYNIDELVFDLGVQYASMINGNLNQDTFLSVEKWRACENKNWLMSKFSDGTQIDSGLALIHNYRDAGYRQFFSMGIHNFGGYSNLSGGLGRDFQFTGVHKDGTVITGDSTLEALFDVGGGNEYPYLDIIAPDIVGVRTIVDVRGTFRRYVDALAGLTEDVGGVGSDNLPNITGGVNAAYYDSSSVGIFQTSGGAFALSGGIQTQGVQFAGSINTSKYATFDLNASISSSKYTSKDSVEPANIVDGLPFFIVMQEITTVPVS